MIKIIFVLFLLLFCALLFVTVVDAQDRLPVVSLVVVNGAASIDWSIYADEDNLDEYGTVAAVKKKPRLVKIPRLITTVPETTVRYYYSAPTYSAPTYSAPTYYNVPTYSASTYYSTPVTYSPSYYPLYGSSSCPGGRCFAR